MPTFRPIPRLIGSTRDARGNQLPDKAFVQPGTGITAATGEIVRSSIDKVGDIFVTRYLLDLTGLQSSTTDLDIIGSGAGPAFFGRISTTDSGTILGGTVQCLEVPAGGVVDIDIYAATEATGVFDAGIASLTETAVLTSGGNWTIGRELATIPDTLANNAYLYLVNGAAGTVGTYTAGRILITLYGV